MASVLAVVSKAVFEDLGGALREGDVWATSLYASKNAGLASLSEGGALFLVTVRPLDERLWLVAVLESPKPSKGAWLSAPNMAPIVDVTSLLPKLRFASGKGVKAAPGKLGMALQTPRVLTADDVALLRSAWQQPLTATKPAPQEAPSAERAGDVIAALTSGFEALDTASQAEISAIVAQAARAPKKAFAAMKLFAQKTGTNETARLGLDLLAAACLDKSPSYAADAFAQARAIEKKLKHKVPIATQLARATAFAERGALSLREATALFVNCAAAKEPLDGEALSSLAIAVMRDETPSSALIKAIAKLGDAILAASLRGWLTGAAPDRFDEVDAETWGAAGDVLGALVREDAGVRAWAREATARDVRGWIPLLAQWGLMEAVVRHEPAHVAPLLHHVFSLESRWQVLDANLLSLARAMLDVALPVLRASDEPFSIALPGTSALLNVYLVDMLLAAGVKLLVPQDRRPFFGGLYHQKPALVALGLPHVLEDPALRACVLTLFSLRIDAPLAPEMIEALVNFKGAEHIIETLAENLRWIARSPLGSFDAYLPSIEAIAQPALVQRFPVIEEAFREIDPAKLLCEQLRAGSMDEWEWPAQEEAAERLGRSFQNVGWAGTMGSPFMLYQDKPSGRTIVAGPEGITLDAIPEAPTFCWSRPIGDDVLVWDENVDDARWLMRGAHCQVGRFDFLLGVFDGAFIHGPSMTLVRSGDTTVGAALRRLATNDHVLIDRDTVALLSQFSAYRADGTAWAENTGAREAQRDVVSYDPRVGKELPGRLPAWMLACFPDDDPDAVMVDTSKSYRTMGDAERSPVGARDGVSGLAVIRSKGRVRATRADGVSWEGTWKPLELITFPEREAVYPIGHEERIERADGAVLVPPKGFEQRAYWGGGPQPLSSRFWQNYRPRDPRGSRALAQCSEGAARAIFEAALMALEHTPTRAPQQEKRDYGDLVAIFTAPAEPDDLATYAPALIEAVKAALPEVTHPRLLAGIASLAKVAVSQQASLARIASTFTQTAPPDEDGLIENAQASAIAKLWNYHMAWWTEQLGTKLGAQIKAIGRYLFEETTEQPLVPPRTAFPWQHGLIYLGELLYRALSLGTPEDARAQLVAFLRVWADAGFADHASHMRVMQITFSAPPAKSIDEKHPDRAFAWENRYFLRLSGASQDRHVFIAVEYARDGVFRLPPGATLDWEKRADGRFSSARILEALSLLEQRGPVRPSPENVAVVVEATGLGRSGAGLLMTAALRPWFASSEVRAALGLRVDDVNLGSMDLGWFHDSTAYSELMPSEPEALYRSEGAVHTGVLWATQMGRKVRLDEPLAHRLRDELRDSSLQLDQIARALTKPDALDWLTKDAVWYAPPIHRPFDEQHRRLIGLDLNGQVRTTSMSDAHKAPDTRTQFTMRALWDLAPALAWAAIELPVGDPLRRGAGRAAALLRERLASEDLLVTIGSVDVSQLTDSDARRQVFDTLSARFSGDTYLGVSGKPHGAGFDRGDLVATMPADAPNGFFLAMRPAHLTTASAYARFAETIGLGKPLSGEIVGTALSLGLADTVCVDARWVSRFFAWRAPAFQRMLDALIAPAHQEGAWLADPRVSAPQIVAAQAKRHAVSEDAATLLLEVSALADPTVARLLRINRWTRETYDAAAKELLAKKLLVTAKYERTERTLFVPGPVLPLGAPASPLEASKAALYGLDPEQPLQTPVFEVVLPLCPMGELYERVHQRA